MGNEDYSECSASGSDCNRPLKKAKYVWQVKGNYHLKNRAGNPADEPLPSSSEPKVEDQCKGKCIDTFLARTEKILDSDDEEGRDRPQGEVPVSLVAPHPKAGDYYLRKWQARQIARGYIDNTINSVLETWVTHPPFDAEDFIENCAQDGHIEDEGILMAIRAHGLMANSHVAQVVHPDELADNTLDKIDTVRSQIIKEGFSQETLTGIDSLEQEMEEDEEEMDVPYPSVDLLNAAIMVAIEKKGLSHQT